MSETAQTFLSLVDRAQTLDTVGDALRILRDLLPTGAGSEQARNLRKQVTLLRARLRDAAELERSGLRGEADAREEERRLSKFARAIARDVVEAVDPGLLHTAVQSLSLALSSREQARSPDAPLAAGQIFLSYRRADSAPVTGVIREHLVHRFGRSAVFMDIDSIPLGVNFRAHIVSTLAQCKACLAIIGPAWVDARDDRGARRLEDIDDPIRIELEVAMRIDRRVIPILVDGAGMPRREDLPEAMRMLCSQNGFPLRPGGDFNGDIKRLMDLLEQQMF
jgi:hypothetical protein